MEENNQAARRNCPSCGREIPKDSPPGICPRCVLQGVADDVAETEQATRTAKQFGMQPPTPGEIAAAFPQFEVLELIGSGGMGAVFRVRQPRLDREAALKVLPRALAGDPHFTERFTREARALAKLNHPNIVAVYDFGEAGGFHYLLMEYVDGANLRGAMKAGKFTPEEAFAVVPEICAALQYAHDEGVLHRDIKPENLLLDTKGRVKIADFGIAKLVGEDSAALATLTGSLAPGTPQYMAPEQLERSPAVDHRADIYSLGVVFYEMLTGELPLGRFAAPSAKAGVGGKVDDIVFRSLEKEPAMRQQSAGEVKTQVEGVAVEPPQPPKPAPRATPATSRPSRLFRRAAILLGGAALLFLVAAIGMQLWQLQFRKETERLERAREVEMLAARAEVDKLRVRAGTAQMARLPEMEVLDHIDKYNQALSDLSALDREHDAEQRARERSDRIARMSASWLFLGIHVVCIAMAIVGVVMFVGGWRSRQKLRRPENPASP